jgi:preprotein translocase subunit SecG
MIGVSRIWNVSAVTSGASFLISSLWFVLRPDDLHVFVGFMPLLVVLPQQGKGGTWRARRRQQPDVPRRRGGATVLTKATTVLAVLFMVALSLSISAAGYVRAERHTGAAACHTPGGRSRDARAGPGHSGADHSGADRCSTSAAIGTGEADKVRSVKVEV